MYAAQSRTHPSSLADGQEAVGTGWQCAMPCLDEDAWCSQWHVLLRLLTLTVHLQGTIPGHTHSYSLDDHHHFQTGKPMLVCGNTAAMLGERNLSWLSKHFSVRQLLGIHLLAFASCTTGQTLLGNTHVMVLCRLLVTGLRTMGSISAAPLPRGSQLTLLPLRHHCLQHQHHAVPQKGLAASAAEDRAPLTTL